MAVNKKITELTADTDPTTDDLFVIVNDPAGTPETRKVTGTNATKALATVVGDSGSGGTKGLVPAPGAGDAAAGKFLKADGTFAVPTGGTPGAHATSHESGGGDELDLTGMTGLLATAQTPAAHKTSHQSGGSDAIKLDDLAAPDDNTDLNASTSTHGLLPKLNNSATSFLNGQGAWATPAGAGDVAGPGSSTDNALARFDSTTGKIIQNSAVTVDDNGAVTVPEIAAPSTPASGMVAVYAKSDGKLYIKDDAGTETDLTGGGGGGSPGGSDGDIQYRVDASTFGGSPLKRADANTVEQRNSTNGQSFRVLRTYTSSTNHDGVRLGNDGSGNVVVGTFQGSGGGTAQQLKIQGATLSLETISAGTPTGRIEITSSNMQPASSNVMALGTDSRNYTQIHLRTGVMFNDGATNNESPKIIRTDASLEVKTLNDGAPTYLFFKDAGRKRVTAQFDKTNTTLADITGLSESVRASVVYSFEVDLFVDADATGGFKFAIGGTATATSIIYQIMFLDNAADTYTINSRHTALASSAGAAGPTAGYCRIKGTIVVNAAGTLTAQFAQNAASGTSSVLANSTMRIWKF